MVTEEKYRVIGYNGVSGEWLITRWLPEEAALSTFNQLQPSPHYNHVDIVKKVNVIAKLVYTLE